MRKLFFQMMVSADGYIEGQTPWDIDWHVVDNDFNRYVADMLSSIDAILLGRTTYQGFAAYWPTSTDPEARAMNDLPKIVFSTTLEKVDWSNSRLVKEDAAQEVARLKQLPGKDLALFSNGLAASLAPHGLIDEYRFFVNPVVLGGGTPVLKGVKERIDLKLVKTGTLGSGVVTLYYQPA